MLTQVKCTQSSCPDGKKLIRLWDGQGLYLEVSAGGSKRWFYRFKLDKTEKRLAMGSFPDVSLSKARSARDKARISKSEGLNPIEAKKKKKLIGSSITNNTFLLCAEEWLDNHKENWSESHYKRERRNIEKDLAPFLGHRDIASIEPVELLNVIRKVEARGALDVAHRVHLTAHSIWAYAVATSRANRDITVDIKKALKPHIRKNYPAIVDEQEFAQLLKSIDSYFGGPIIKAGLKITAILFQRPGNIRAMKWADLDFNKKIWTIPSMEMKRLKSEKINGSAHLVPLPSQVIHILTSLRFFTGNSEYVFPGLRNTKKPMSEAALNAALAAMGYKGRHVWHGFRASGRTLIRQSLKYDPDVIETQLAHKGQITHGGAYDRTTFLEERAKMLQEWADFLDKLLFNKNPTPVLIAA